MSRSGSRLKKNILTAGQLKQEIIDSHHRSRQYGIDQEKRRPEQKRITSKELENRRSANKDLLEVGCEYIDEFYDLLSPDLFIIAIVDREGYILYLSGNPAIKAEFAAGNYAPGFRFLEKDVGTTATSLCLEKQIPVQLNDKDHYCIQAHGYTSSAAPIFGQGGRLQGALVVSGKDKLVHNHTLIMVTSAARSIERQIRLIRRNRELSLYSGFLGNVLESAETGLMILDNDMCIWMTNRKARHILKQERLDGEPVTILKGFSIDPEAVYRQPDAWKEKESYITHPGGVIHLVYSAQPVISDNGRRLGVVLVFEEFLHIKKITDKLSGNNAFFTFNHLVGKSPAFLKTVSLARRASGSDSTVLLMGETGTGKELFAQAIHNAGPRRKNPFIPVNCGAIPGELMESELFGYVDGAFSGALKGGRPGRFELADGGTLLLDEIGDMPHNMQVKLLRVLQTGEIQPIGSTRIANIDVRIIAATNVNLINAVDQNRFRKDLFYRLNILPITIPPLRERGENDIRALTQYFLKKYDSPCFPSPETLDLLTTYAWPGNVRELENTIQRAIHLCDKNTLEPGHLNLPDTPERTVINQTGTLHDMTRHMIASTLAQTGCNMKETAGILGISRATLYRKVKAYNIRTRKTG